MSEWVTTIRHQDKGVVVSLYNGTIYTLVGRVAYNRFASKNPFRTFASQLRRVLERAEKQAEEAS